MKYICEAEENWEFMAKSLKKQFLDGFRKGFEKAVQNVKKTDPEEIRRGLQRFKMDMMQEMPFYGDILMRVEIREDKNVETAQTNGRRIIYNPDFFAQLNAIPGFPGIHPAADLPESYPDCCKASGFPSSRPQIRIVRRRTEVRTCYIREQVRRPEEASLCLSLSFLCHPVHMTV